MKSLLNIEVMPNTNFTHNLKHFCGTQPHMDLVNYCWKKKSKNFFFILPENEKKYENNIITFKSTQNLVLLEFVFFALCSLQCLVVIFLSLFNVYKSVQVHNISNRHRKNYWKIEQRKMNTCINHSIYQSQCTCCIYCSSFVEISFL